jgi:hypothetical protein
MWDVNGTPHDRKLAAANIFNGHSSIVEVRVGVCRMHLSQVRTELCLPASGSLSEN